jgi:hypothetical protein
MTEHEYWTAQNTGWSGGVSWFNSGGSQLYPIQCKTREEALELAAKYKKQLTESKHRIVHRKIVEEVFPV